MPADRTSGSSTPRSSRAARLTAAGCSSASVAAAARAVGSSSSASSSSSARASPLAPLPANIGLEPRVSVDRNVRKPSPAQSPAPSEASTAASASRKLSERLELLKKRGNEAFERKSYAEAYLYYTACIHEAPVPDGSFHLNRALLASRCHLWEQALYDARRAFEALVEAAKCSGLSKAEMAHAGSSYFKQWQHRCAKAQLREAEALYALGRDPRPPLQACIKLHPSEQAQTLLAQVDALCAGSSDKPKFGLQVDDYLALPWQLVACYGARGLFPSEEEYEARLEAVKREFREGSSE